MNEFGTHAGGVGAFFRNLSYFYKELTGLGRDAHSGSRINLFDI